MCHQFEQIMEKEQEREKKTKKKKRKQESRAKADRDSKQPRRVQATTDSISDLAKEIPARLVLVEEVEIINIMVVINSYNNKEKGEEE